MNIKAKYRKKTDNGLSALNLIVASCFLFSCSREEKVPVTADFTIDVLENDYSVPVQLKVTNLTLGADTYNWSFNGGVPPKSAMKNPGIITYSNSGDYTIKLEATNRDGSLGTKEISLSLKPEPKINFTTEILENSFPPVVVKVVNTSSGLDTYNWIFSDGEPPTSTFPNPENVVFSLPGEHTITLSASNGLETFKMQKTITVLPHLVAEFEYEVSFEDEDLQAPLTLTTSNHCVSATSYKWTFEGGNPATSTDLATTVTFPLPGTYTLALDATNGKESESTSKTITILPNLKIRTFHGIELGTNSAHNGNVIGAFFSTKNREVYTKEEVNNSNGADIDIVFFGLNQNFKVNEFVSPDRTETFALGVIPKATHTKFINSIESCDCSASLSVDQFDAMTNDDLLAGLTIVENDGGLKNFDNSKIPRIVLFQTHDGRIGAIKISDFVANGIDSYIKIDIKVQKEPNLSDNNG